MELDRFNVLHCIHFRSGLRRFVACGVKNYIVSAFVYVHFSSTRSPRIRSRDCHSSLESARLLSCRPAASQRPVKQCKSTCISTEGWIPAELLLVRDVEEMHLQQSAIIVPPRWPFATQLDPYLAILIPAVETLPAPLLYDLMSLSRLMLDSKSYGSYMNRLSKTRCAYTVYCPLSFQYRRICSCRV